MPWAIATSGPERYAGLARELLALPDDTPMITRDQVRYAKPDPDLFLTAARQIGVDIRQSNVVGDSVWDLLAAQRARALGIGLLSGGYGREELFYSGAYRVFEDPADLLAHLDEVGVRRRTERRPRRHPAAWHDESVHPSSPLRPTLRALYPPLRGKACKSEGIGRRSRSRRRRGCTRPRPRDGSPPRSSSSAWPHALKARTYGDLEQTVADLPGPRPRSRRPPARRTPLGWAVATVRANPMLILFAIPVVAVTLAMMLAAAIIWMVLMVVVMVLGGGRRGPMGPRGPWMYTRRGRGFGPPRTGDPAALAQLLGLSASRAQRARRSRQTTPSISNGAPLTV